MSSSTTRLVQLLLLRSSSLESKFLGGGSLDSTLHTEEGLVPRKKEIKQCKSESTLVLKAKAQRSQECEVEQ